MYTKLALAAFVAAVVAQEIPDIDDVVEDASQLATSLPTLADDIDISIPTDALSSDDLGINEDDILPLVSSFIQEYAPTAAVSDLPTAFTSAVPEIENLLEQNGLTPEQAQSYASAFFEVTPEQLAEIESILPGSASLVDLPGAIASQAATMTDDIDIPAITSALVTGTGSASTPGRNGTVTAPTTMRTSPAGGDDQAASTSSVSTGGAVPAGQLVGWTGALAGVAAGMVAFL